MKPEKHKGSDLRKTLLFLILAPAIAFAVEDNEVATCAANNNTVQRLACFDDLAKRHNLAPASTVRAVAAPGKWWTQTNTDPLNDKAVHIASLSAESGRGRFGDAIGMVIRCKDNKTEMYINWESFLGMDGARITHRVGKEQAISSNWSVSTDHKASFFPGSPVPTLKRMLTETSFVANVTPYSESPITATFDLTGIEGALAEIRSGCNW